MLLKGLYDFSPREADANKTLSFRANDILIFLDVYERDENWLSVADKSGHIGYVPKNYVEMNEDCSKDSVLEFLVGATIRARREKLDSLETLEYLKEHVVRIEYRDFQTRLLRKALSFQPEMKVEIEDCSSNEITPSASKTNNYNKTIQKDDTGSVTSYATVKSEKTFDSIKSAPVKSSNTKIPASNRPNTDLGKKVSKHNNTPVIVQPVSSRASKSCPLGPNVIRKSSREENSVVDNKASGDNITAVQRTPSHSNRTIILDSKLRETSKTRIPVRTPNNKSVRSQQTAGTYSISNSSDREHSQPSSRRYLESNSDDNWEKMAARLITIVQESGGLDMKQSEVVVHRVLHHVQEHFNPGMPEKVGSILRILEKSPKRNSAYIDNGACKTFLELLKFLTSVGKRGYHNDGSESHTEDESVILDKLDQFHEELMSLDIKLLQHAMEMNHYHGLHDLVLLYQSENRTSIKNKLMEIFSMIATMDNTGRSVLLRSILPIQLSREMYGNEGSPRKLSRVAGVLISLMSAGEPMPETHYDYDPLGTRFITFILNFLEEPAQGEADEKAKADLMNLLLAYNLQFTPKDENYVIKTLAGRSPGKFFIETLLYLFENEIDPIKGGSQPLESVPHSVFKLTKDMFSCKTTAEHFHTPEMKVLIDSMIKRLLDLGPGDNRRTDYLELMWFLLRNRSFQYRISDIRECLVSILLEEDLLSIPHQRIIKGISKEFPLVFKKGSLTSIAGSRSRADEHNAF